MLGAAAPAISMPPGDPWLPTDPSSGAVPRGRSATQWNVYRFTRPSGPLQPLPSLVCTDIWLHEGPDPGSASFRYKFDDVDVNSPQTLEAALSTAITLAETVNPGDELVVTAVNPSGREVPIFDGVALDFHGTIGPRTERVDIACVGIAYRAWDIPHPGQYMRGAANLKDTSRDMQTDLRCVFNPDGQPNKTPKSAPAKLTTGQSCPIFADPNRIAVPSLLESWTLPDSGRYLCYLGNGAQTYVQNPTEADLDALFARVPVGGFFDPTDATTYTAKPIQSPDFPFTGKSWPDALYALVHDVGFGQAWRLTSNGSGFPQTQLDLYLQQSGPIKKIYLPQHNADLDPALCNVDEFSIARSLHEAINAWSVEGALNQYEVSVILAPGYPAAAGDASNLDNFKRDNPTFVSGGYKDKYRLYIADECGDGHYAAGGSTVSQTPFNWDSVFGAPVGGVPLYAYRTRPAKGHKLLSVDPAGKVLKVSLSISKAYAGAQPGLWDGTATDWQQVEGGYELLDDRLGVWINVESIARWNIGKPASGVGCYPGGIVNGVEDQATGSHFALRLTCVVESDAQCKGLADVLAAAPIQTRTLRRVDARDRLFYQAITQSEFNSGALKVVRDDGDLALAEATALRYASQAGVLEGPVVVPYFSAFYALGDRISGLAGRGLSFRTDGGGTNNAPVYPCIVAIHWQKDHGERTTLTLSDAVRGRNFRAQVKRTTAKTHHGV